MIRSLVRQLYSSTALNFSYFYLKFMEETLKYTLYKKTQLLCSFHFFSQWYAKVPDYQAVRLSICTCHVEGASIVTHIVLWHRFLGLILRTTTLSPLVRQARSTENLCNPGLQGTFPTHWVTKDSNENESLKSAAWWRTNNIRLGKCNTFLTEKAKFLFNSSKLDAKHPQENLVKIIINWRIRKKVGF